MKFDGKVVAITGGGQGIGLGFARALIGEGAAVAILDIDEARAAKAARTLQAAGGKAMSAACDVADEAQVQAAIDAVIMGLGGVDVLINGAAKHLMEFNAPPLSLPREKWRQMLDVNVTGIVNCAAAARASMRARGGGVILNIASIAGFVATSSYGVSKLAVRGLTVALASELAGDNIRVCCIAPGIVDSDAAMSDVPREIIDEFIQQRQLIKRQGRVEDLVKAMLYLCSDDASFVTGETLIVGGGFPLRV